MLKEMPCRKSSHIHYIIAVISIGTVSLIPGCLNDPKRAVPHDIGCKRHLERLAIGLKTYRAEHEELPAAFMSDSGRKHSWRVLLAPYAAAISSTWSQAVPSFESSYRFDQPWDSPDNRAAVRFLPRWGVFVCPAESLSSSFVSYLMLVRPLDENGKPPPLPPDAVLIVESAGCGIELAEPRDIQWDSLWEGESPFGKGKLNSLHPYVVNAIRVDGKVIGIPKNMAKADVLRLLKGTADGE